MNTETAGVWVKASERLQTDDHEYVFLKGCRVDKGILRIEQWPYQPHRHIVLYHNEGLGINQLSAWREGHDELDKIFWLDESQPTLTIQQALEVWDDAEKRGMDVMFKDSWGKLTGLADKHTYFLNKFGFDIEEMK